MSTSNRPLSPHLQVYKPQLTSMLSILHRITGFGLAMGALMGTWWLVSVMSGTEAYEVFYSFCKSFIGQLMLFCWLYAFIYHMMNGIRHLFWDTGRGLDIKNTYRSGWAVFFGSILLATLIWVTM